MEMENLKPKKAGRNYRKKFQQQWMDDYPAWRTWVKCVPDKPTKFYCEACQVTLNCGISEIKRHAQRESHVKFIKLKKLDILDNEMKPSTSSSGLTNGSFDFKDRVRIAELRLSMFFVEHNIPYCTSNALLTLIKEMSKEPEVIAAMTLGKTKMVNIINCFVACQKPEPVETVLIKPEGPHSLLENTEVKPCTPIKRNKLGKRHQLSDETLNSISIIKDYLKCTRNTALSMPISKEHLESFKTRRRLMNKKPQRVSSDI